MNRTIEGTDESDSMGFQESPCRAAARYMTACPMCKRVVNIKTLRYTHMCGHSWDVAERAKQQQIAAHAAIRDWAKDDEHVPEGSNNECNDLTNEQPNKEQKVERNYEYLFKLGV